LSNKGITTLYAVILTAIIVGAVVAAAVWYFKPPDVIEPEPKPGEGLKIFMQHAGGPDDPFIVAGFAGAETLAADLGIEIVTRYGGDDISGQLTLIEEAIAADYDVIISNIGDSIAFDEPFQRAIDQGIIVIGYDDDDNTPNPRQGFVGSGDLYNLGYQKAQWLEEEGIAEGAKVVMISEDPGATWAVEIIEGHKDYFEEIGKEIEWDILETGFEISEIEQRVVAYLLANQDIDGIMNVGMVSSIGTVLALEHLEEFQPGDVIFIGGVSDEIDIRGIREGYTNVAFALSPGSYGFDAVLMAYNFWKYGILPHTVEHSTMKVTIDNVDILEASIAEGMF
jgi:simple sugar transport system substrate-binding protein